MIRTKEQLTKSSEDNSKGIAKLYISDLAEFEGKNQKLRTFAMVELKPGEEIEYHTHTGEGENCYIISGKGEYNDNGEMMEIVPGMATFTSSGSGHGIKNTGSEMLIFIALILLD